MTDPVRAYIDSKGHVHPDVGAPPDTRVLLVPEELWDQMLPPPTRLGLVHYMPTDQPTFTQHTACGLPQSHFTAEPGTDKYQMGCPRPGQITCGTCATHVPRWWDPEWDEPALDERLVDIHAEPSDLELRMWAVEQAIAAGAVGKLTIRTDADDFIAYVKGDPNTATPYGEAR